MITRLIVIFVVISVCFVARGCDDGGVVAPCNFDEDCRADAICLEGVCALRAPPVVVEPPAPCDVAAGTHDGGDGTCVALDACSEGFTLLFRDGDGDGVGTGARVDCGALPPPLGLADVDGDCDDDDPTGFVVTTSLADVDNDGFTTTITACGDGAPPAGAPTVPGLAPIIAAYPADPLLMLADDAGVTVQVQRFLSNVRVDLSALRCPVLPATPTGAAIHVRLRLVSACCVATRYSLVVGARFGGAEAPSAERIASSDPVSVGETIDVVIGGRNETFDTDLATACDNGVSVSVLGLSLVEPAPGAFADAASVVVDTAWVELFAAEDCDDDDPARYAPTSLYDDSDGDGQGGGEPIAACLDSDLPPLADGHIAPLDCDDADADARLGQTLFFSEPSTGGSFDYDCSGLVEEQALSTAAGCFDDGKGSCVPDNTTITGVCGALVDVQTCDGSCAPASAPVVQPCR